MILGLVTASGSFGTESQYGMTNRNSESCIENVARLRSDRQGCAVFWDSVWAPGRSRADGFGFFGILRAVSRRRDCAPPGLDRSVRPLA